jgi:hypothetical protein
MNDQVAQETPSAPPPRGWRDAIAIGAVALTMGMTVAWIGMALETAGRAAALQWGTERELAVVEWRATDFKFKQEHAVTLEVPSHPSGVVERKFIVVAEWYQVHDGHEMVTAWTLGYPLKVVEFEGRYRPGLVGIVVMLAITAVTVPLFLMLSVPLLRRGWAQIRDKKKNRGSPTGSP